MKTFWCGAVIPDCRVRFEGATVEDILAQVAAHAAKDHGIKHMPANVTQRVRDLIQEPS
ncbi:MAG: hypothetical protein JWN04_3892 [Myxococcaceae bacterium]|nr:hypothetical protein [Myxococcaceae bacterium]